VTYVLVSLVADDDEATRWNDEFARWFASEHPPAAAFHGEMPDHAAVRMALEKLPKDRTPTALVFCHDGGGTLRARSVGDPWADAAKFADTFVGARVWVYACDTRGTALNDDLDSFGRWARDHGIEVFVGHASAVAAPPPSPPNVRTYIYQALGRAFRAFLQGEERPPELRRAALPSQRSWHPNDVIAATFGALSVKEAFETLRVLGRTR